MSAIYVADPKRFVSYYEDQARTGKNSPVHRIVQRGGGLGGMLGSLHSEHVPLPKHKDSHESNKNIITPKIQSPAEGSVQRAKENLKNENNDDIQGEIHVIPVPVPPKKRRATVKRASSKKSLAKRGRRKNTLEVNDYFSKI